MKISIRKKFIFGIVFFFVIIVALLTLSTYHISRLANKTGTMFKDNHLSIIYARDMGEGFSAINQEIVNGLLTNKNPDNTLINKTLITVNKSLQLEKSNITEPGEDKLAQNIEYRFGKYRDLINLFLRSPKDKDNIINLQNEYTNLKQQILLLSQMNENAIEYKTNDAKISAKNAKLQIEVFGTFCFLIALSFTFNFTSYFNERFSQLYNGIKEIVASNYGQRLHFDGKDEFYEISLVFNEMAEKLVENNQNIISNFKEDIEYKNRLIQVQELKRTLERMKMLEEQATELIANLENQK